MASIDSSANPHSSEMLDHVLNGMRDHVISLQDKLSLASSTLTKTQGMNEKIAIMKEYKEKVASLNSSCRSKDRRGLIANLQQENRQILALEEENKQLRCALKEMEGGLDLIMSEFRRLLSGFMQSDLLLSFSRANETNRTQPIFVNNSDPAIEKYKTLAQMYANCLSLAEYKIASDQESIAQLSLENKELRSLLLPLPKP